MATQSRTTLLLAMGLGAATLLSACERQAPQTNAASAGDSASAATGSVAETPPDPATPDTTGAGFVQGGVESPPDGAAEAGTEESPPPTPGALVMSDDDCTTDADCVPQQCCHATSCGSQANAEACGPDTACTMDCRANTMDCGGGCLCQQGKCAAQLWAAPAPN